MSYVAFQRLPSVVHSGLLFLLHFSDWHSAVSALAANSLDLVTRGRYRRDPALYSVACCAQRQNLNQIVFGAEGGRK